MNYYESSIMDVGLKQKFAFIEAKAEDHVLTLTLDREEKKNALHPHMVNEIAYVLQYAKQTNSIWMVLLRSKGDVFCAGADLKAFMGQLVEFDSSIPSPSKEILVGELFGKVHKPIITQIEGDVYAGGFLFLAGATYVLANAGIKLGLPEVKRGLFPFQVMSALLEVMPRRIVIDWCIRGYNLDVADALKFGLITHISSDKNMDKLTSDIIDQIKANSPTAIRMGLEAIDHISPKSQQNKYLKDMLTKTVISKDGQEGLLAFKEKRKPNWVGE